MRNSVGHGCCVHKKLIHEQGNNMGTFQALSENAMGGYPPMQHKKRQFAGQKTIGVGTKVAITFASLVRIQIFLVILKVLFKAVLLAV